MTVAAHRGRWVLAVTVEAPDLHRGRCHPDRRRRFVGLDLGLSALVVGARSDRSEVERVPPPAPLAGDLPKIRRANRVLSRRQPGSGRRRRAQVRLARAHAPVANRRHNFCHELTSRLVKTHDGLCLESLAVANLMANHHLARSIGDASWGRLYRQLSYKAAWYGTQVMMAPRFFASTRTCSSCGALKDSMALSERVFRCEECGMTADRDTNAAANLAAWAEAEVSPRQPRPRTPKSGAGSPTPVEGPALAVAYVTVKPDPRPHAARPGGSGNRQVPERGMSRRPEEGAARPTYPRSL